MKEIIVWKEVAAPKEMGDFNEISIARFESIEGEKNPEVTYLKNVDIQQVMLDLIKYCIDRQLSCSVDTRLVYKSDFPFREVLAKPDKLLSDFLKAMTMNDWFKKDYDVMYPLRYVKMELMIGFLFKRDPQTNTYFISVYNKNFGYPSVRFIIKQFK